MKPESKPCVVNARLRLENPISKSRQVYLFTPIPQDLDFSPAAPFDTGGVLLSKGNFVHFSGWFGIMWHRQQSSPDEIHRLSSGKLIIPNRSGYTLLRADAICTLVNITKRTLIVEISGPHTISSGSP